MSGERVVALGEVTRWLSGGTPPRANRSYWQGSIPWISAATLKTFEISTSAQFLTEDGVRAGSRLAPIGATLLLVRGMAVHQEVRTGLVTGSVAFNQDVKALRPVGDIEPAFLTYSLLAAKDRILRLVTSAGSGTGVVETGALRRLPVWLPLRDEQVRIAAALDAIRMQVDQLELAIVKSSDVLTGLRQSLLSGVSRMPGHRDPWEAVRLGDRLAPLRSVPLSRAEMEDHAGVHCLHYGDIHTFAGCYLSPLRERLARAPSARAKGADRLREGDLVFADASEDASGVGRALEVDVVPSDGLIAGLHTIALRPRRGTFAKHFGGQLQYVPSFRRQLVRLASGTKVLATSRRDLAGISLALPSTSEQEAIVEVLLSVEEEIAATERLRDKMTGLFAAALQELLPIRLLAVAT